MFFFFNIGQRNNLLWSHGQVGKMGSGAIALSLPFACILGLLASMTATTMGRQACNSSFVISYTILFALTNLLLCWLWNLCPVKRKYVWVYATIQFALVVLSAHLLYSLVRLALLTLSSEHENVMILLCETIYLSFGLQTFRMRNCLISKL